MLDRQHGNIVFECDGCGDILDTETSNFNAARNMLKRDGWRAIKIGTDWQHYCTGCDQPTEHWS
jgi:hypothetical protein